MNIIGVAPFKRSIATCYEGTPWISMKIMSGIDLARVGMNRAFSAQTFTDTRRSWGVAPGFG